MKRFISHISQPNKTRIPLSYLSPSQCNERKAAVNPTTRAFVDCKTFTPSTIKMTFSSTIGAIQLNRDSESACRHRTIFIFSVSLNWPPQLFVCPLSTNPFHMSWGTNNSCYYFAKVSQFVCPPPDQHQRRLLSTYVHLHYKLFRIEGSDYEKSRLIASFVWHRLPALIN